MITPTADDIGRSVIYIPGHVEGDETHKDCEHGILTSYNPNRAFVRYGSQPNAKATSFCDLVWAHGETK